MSDYVSNESKVSDLRKKLRQKIYEIEISDLDIKIDKNLLFDLLFHYRFEKIYIQ